MGTVLVIEDDDDIRELARVALDLAGHAVATVANGPEALRWLEQRRPCVILLDIMMPGMDGLAFLAERRRRRLAEGVPVVCVTAAGEVMQHQALQLGAEECLGKPTDIDQLCSVVTTYCSN